MAINDDYLPCSSYLGKAISETNPKITIFQDEKTTKFYFGLLAFDSSILLKSEGYTTAKARENGLNSVLKNIENESLIEIVTKGKTYIVVLKAKNRKEIAQSCGFASKKMAQIAKDELLVFNNLEVEGNEITSSIEPVELEIKLGEYLAPYEYLNKERLWDTYGVTGFTKFQYENGYFYFAVYNHDGSLYLGSKGYATEIERDLAFDLMESSILLEENYKVENIEGKYYNVLFEEEETLAVSESYDTFISAFIHTPAGRPQENGDSIF